VAKRLKGLMVFVLSDASKPFGSRTLVSAVLRGVVACSKMFLGATWLMVDKFSLF